MASRIYDTIIIGGGPAGITAAIYLARRNLNILLIYKELGGQASITSDIENYSGFKLITGMEFSKKLNEHLQAYKITCFNEEVTKVNRKRKNIQVITQESKYFAKSVIIASGARQRMLNIKGEKEFLNKGVAYYATCDAPLFRNKRVAIVGGAHSALEAAIQLEKYARKIYIITKNQELRGEKILINKIKNMKKVKVYLSSVVKEISGRKFVSSLILAKKEQQITLPVNGIFIEIGYRPNSEIINAEKNEIEEIIINNNNETSVKGIFAAGDVTNIPMKQIIVAAGEGAKAALSAAEYIDKL